jgi:eukaryotic-like serine/threonine-protein kinase
MASPDPDPRIGQVVDGRYRILERLAQGGMGVVYRAERVPVGKTVAVKFLHRIYADDKASLARFERETRVLSKLTHPNCVSVIDFGVDGSPYLVMDFAGGITLRAALDAGKMPLADAVAILRQVLAGLAHAHAQGVIHRDLKPANIMISDEIGTGRHVRLLDFGLARLASSSVLTQSSVAIGTPSYMAPEQTVGGDVDERTDIYQVGVVMFEMITGERLFVAEETSQLLEMHRTAKVPRIAEVAPTAETKPGLDELLQRALAKEPAQRWQSAMELAAALDDVVAGRWRKPRRVLRTAAVAAAVVVLGGAALAGVTFGRRLLGSEAPGASAPVAAANPPAASPERPAPQGADESALHEASDAFVGEPIATDAATDALALDAGAALPDAALAATLSDATLAAASSDASGPDAAPLPASAATAPDAGGDADDVSEEAVSSADPAAEERAEDPTSSRPVAAPPRPQAPLAKSLPAAMTLIKQGKNELAIASLRALWNVSRRDARYPYLLGNLYFDKHWWTVGMEHYTAAIARLGAYKGNPTLIRNVISAIGDRRTRGKAVYLLTKVIGQGSKGYLRTAARNHPDLSVRKAAQALLKRF